MFALSFFSSLALVSLAAARVQFLGMAISGGDFGCQIDGSCPTGSTQLPLSSLGGGDGQGQMKHFVQDDKLNMFRLPISWQFLTKNQLGATLDATNLGKYDQLVQACLATGAYCMIDIHNFARWNGGIIGQGGPTDDQFVSLWTQLATKYAGTEKIVFELMNEPHDLDINLWAATCQKVVTAIRNAGAASQMILLPGTNFDSAATLVSSGSADALMGITNPDGSTTNLLLDVHKYLDEDNSGTHSPCTTNNVDAFQTVADYLRSKGRQALISETGASQDSTCLTAFCAQNTFINANSDVFVGLVAWAAGSFSTSYLLSLTPSKNGNSLVDNQLMSQCVLATWNNAPDTVSIPPTTTASATQTAKGSSTSASAQTQRASSSSSRVTQKVGSSTMVLTMETATLDEPTTLMIATGEPTPDPSAGEITSFITAPLPTGAAGGNATGVSNTPKTTQSVSGNWAGQLQIPIGLITACMLVVFGI